MKTTLNLEPRRTSSSPRPVSDVCTAQRILGKQRGPPHLFGRMRLAHPSTLAVRQADDARGISTSGASRKANPGASRSTGRKGRGQKNFCNLWFLRLPKMHPFFLPRDAARVPRDPKTLTNLTKSAILAGWRAFPPPNPSPTHAARLSILGILPLRNFLPPAATSPKTTTKKHNTKKNFFCELQVVRIYKKKELQRTPRSRNRKGNSNSQALVCMCVWG